MIVSRNMYKILIIEDNVKLADSIKDYLGANQYQIHTETDGNDGYLMAQKPGFDLIILDIMLPGKNGFEIAKSLRNRQIETPILILSEKNSIADIVSGLDLGADGYLPKPFSLGELKARIDRLLQRPPHSQQPILIVGDLMVDQDSMLVMRNGQQIDLKRKEYAILLYLIKNKNLVVNKDQIINAVWPLDDDVNYGLIDVYISKLRNKIDGQFENKLLKTIHASGYMISD